MKKNKLKLKNLNILHLEQVVRWIILSFNSEESIPVNHLVSLVHVLKKNQKERGVIGLITLCKSMRSNLLNHLSGNPLRDNGTEVTKDGIPKLLGELIPYVRMRKYDTIKVILTILYSTRSLKLNSDPDFSPITNPPKGDIANVAMFGSEF